MDLAIIQKHDMDLPGLYLCDTHIPLTRIIKIAFEGKYIAIYYDGFGESGYDGHKKRVCVIRVSKKLPLYKKISKWVKSQNVTSDVIAQLKEQTAQLKGQIEQLKDKVNELEHSPNPGAKFLAAQEHYASLAREQESADAKKE